jgi:hypothetical protein
MSMDAKRNELEILLFLGTEKPGKAESTKHTPKLVPAALQGQAVTLSRNLHIAESTWSVQEGRVLTTMGIIHRRPQKGI